MNNVSIFLAFAAGFLSFLSPCVLPLVPAYISYLTGMTIENLNDKRVKINILYKSIGFTIGFSIIFIIMGASITSLGTLFIKNQDIFRKISGILILIFGLHTTGLVKIKFFSTEKQFLSFKRTKGTFGSILMGMAFAAGWTPCVGPILSSILVYASSMTTIFEGVKLLAVYSLGLAIPFVLTAMLIGSFSDKFNKISKYLKPISILSGILMILMGILIFTNKITLLSQYLDFINF